ncbi:hypothetical protein [Segatella copri]|uniref:Uncharacterized protein n=1 Tax=Segatella copri TaxID=165179 RepID=A0AAW5TQX2_9BACT|nr:hypothetical protein [Segatella copri]MCW4076390.1 hypothetical protein [Segatella copri]MCW4092095.1 hypothetical protein [Segatella copri]MCW4109509.1 hypothetical protein [Segatella copri]
MMRQIFYKVIICSCMLMACFVSKAQNAYYFHFHDKGIQVFYTDMVDSMTVSKVDLDGIEHDDFVTQQVWMNDTVFNYALADIDSVSFVTPSTIYQPGVVKLEDGLENYVVSQDSLTIIFRTDTPSDLLPRKKDKLVYLRQTDLFPAGFAGEVVEVVKENSGYKVDCTLASLSDIFVRYYSTSNDNVQTRAINPIYGHGEAIWEAKDLTYPLTDELLPFISEESDDDDAFSVDNDASISLSPKVSLRGTLIVTPEEGTYVCVSSNGTFDVTSNFSLNGSLKVDKVWRFTGEKRWQACIPNCPLLVAFVDPGVFVDASLSASVDATVNQKVSSAFLLNMSTKRRENLRNQPLTFKIQETNFDVGGSVKGELNAGVYTEIGIAVNDIGFCKNDIAKLYARGEVGIHVGGDLEVNSKFLKEGIKNTEAYETLRNSGIWSNFYWGAAIGYQLDLPIINLNFGQEIEWEGHIGEPLFDKCLAPTITSPNAYREHGDFSTITAKADVEGDCLMPVEVGFGAFDSNGNKVASKYYSKKFANENSSFSDYSVALENMSTVKDYELSPVIKLFGHELKAYPSVDVEKTLTLSTYEATDVTESSAKISGGLIGYDKNTENPKVGLVYGTKDAFMQGHATYVSCGTVNGSPSRVFEQTLSGLKDETEYLYVAKAELDGEIVYADTLSFTTLKKEKDETSLKEGLALFYESTGGANWKQNGGWLDNTKPLDYWYGVNMYNSELSLKLNDNNLVGDAILKNIDNIYNIDLSDNTLQSFKIEGGSIAPWGGRFTIENNKARGGMNIFMNHVKILPTLGLNFHTTGCTISDASFSDCTFEEHGDAIEFNSDKVNTIHVEKCANFPGVRGYDRIGGNLDKYEIYRKLNVNEISLKDNVLSEDFQMHLVKCSSLTISNSQSIHVNFGSDCEIDNVVIEDALLHSVTVGGVEKIWGSELYTVGAKINNIVLDTKGSDRQLSFSCADGGYFGSLTIRDCSCFSISTPEPKTISLEKCSVWFGSIFEEKAKNVYRVIDSVVDGWQVKSFEGTLEQLREFVEILKNEAL